MGRKYAEKELLIFEAFKKIIIDNSTIICYTLVNNNLYGGQNEENYK